MLGPFGPGLRQRTERFDEIYFRHVKSVHAYFLGRTNDVDTTLDMVQELFLRVWRHLPRVPRELDRERYWLFAVAKNIVRDHYRRSGRLAAEAPWPSSPAQAPPADEPETSYEAKETLEGVAAAMNSLPTEMRTALVMHVLAGLSSADIGEMLGKPAGTVRYWIHRARAIIAGNVEQTDDAAPRPARGGAVGQRAGGGSHP